MRILGIGVDMVKNRRIGNLLNDKRFINRTFSEKEVKLSNRLTSKTNHFAKRFAAKEAFVKSIGLGFRKNLNLKDIEILNDKLGKPYYFRSKKIDSIVKKLFRIKDYDLFLSITDEKDYSVAFTILQAK